MLLNEEDIKNAFRALSAIKAGLTALISEANDDIDFDFDFDFSGIKRAYLSGAISRGLDLIKFQDLNLIPKSVNRIFKLDNTSLELARDLVLNRDYVYELQDFVKDLRENYVRLSTSKTFEHAYILELSRYEEGISDEKYERLRDKMGIKKFPVPENGGIPEIEDKTSISKSKEEIEFKDFGVKMVANFNCDYCGKCVDICPENALEISESEGIILNTTKCRGFSCLKCEESCEFFKFEKFKFKYLSSS
jgi:methylamine methyltransferase corrinoid activation protein